MEIEPPPEVPERALLYWNCFLETLASSPGGNISTGAVLAWCALFEIRSVSMREDLLTIVRLLQGEYLRQLKTKNRTAAAHAKMANARRNSSPGGSNVQKFKRGG